MTWIAVAIGGSAALGAGASLAGANKQAKGAKNAANLQMQQFQTINRQNQPFIQSGYGALSRLNTLLGINGNASYGMGGTPMQQPPMQAQPRTQGMNGRLAQLLMLRMAHGDTQAAQLLRSMPFDIPSPRNSGVEP